MPRCKILPEGKCKQMMYKIRKVSEGVTIRVKYESGESIDRLELSRFSNANLKSFISNLEIKGKTVIVDTTFNTTLSEYIKNELDFQRVILLLKQCIEVVEEIVKNNFLLMYVDFNMEHIFVSSEGSLQFLYLVTEEDRYNSGVMLFIQNLLKDIKPSDNLTGELLKNIKNKVGKMSYYSSYNLTKMIESAEKDYLNTLEVNAYDVSTEKKEVPVGTSQNFSAVFPQLYNLSTGEIMTYNPGDVIVLSDRNIDDVQIS